MQSTELKLREVLQKIIEIKNKMEGSDWEEIEEAREIARQALTLPTDDVKSVLQSALNVLGCLEYGITGVDSWPCEDSVEDVIHRIRKVLEESQ